MREGARIGIGSLYDGLIVLDVGMVTKAFRDDMVFVGYQFKAYFLIVPGQNLRHLDMPALGH